MHLTRLPLPGFLRRLLWLVLPALSLLGGSCTNKYYAQRTMFDVSEDRNGVVDTAKLRRVVNRASRNYRIQPNDYVSVRVYTNKGEAIIDPNNILSFPSTGGGASNGTPARPITSGNGRSIAAGSNQSSSNDFLVQADGEVRLPIIGNIQLQNLTLLQADSLLKTRYDKYYVESFVRTAVTNNRVTILGASGGQVVALNNDNMNLLEVLALAGGVDGATGGGTAARYGGRVDNIRIIRGDLKNPQVQFVNLHTLEGMRRANLQIEPNDIIYVQPVRRPVLEGLTDATPFFSIASILLTTIGFIITVTR